MKIPAYWRRVRVDPDGNPDPTGPAVAFGWSNESPDAAEQMGLERARRVAEALRRWARGEDDDLHGTGEYYPLERPLREPVVEWLFGDGHARIGAITRNGYGCWVLNTARVAFVDLDLPRPERVGFFARLFGRRPAPVVDEVPQRVAAWSAAHPEVGLRLYRTAAGYRALVTSTGLDPTSPATRALFEGLGSDPLYVRLCEAQESFRARLTPKPWRLSLPSPQTHWFPFDDDPGRQRRFEAWDRRYEAARQGWAVCRFVSSHGPSEVAAEVAPVLALHDRWCLREGAELA